MMATDLPSGTVTFLFTDIEGSTPLWEREPERMRPALARHNAIMQQAVEAQRGHVFKIIGDAFQAAFSLPADGLAAALAAQRALEATDWPTSAPLQVRMGLHTGPAELVSTDYATSHTLNRVARIMAAAHGGQIVLSAEVAELLHGHLPADASLRDLGQHRMKGMTQREHLFQLLAPGLPAEFPPLATLDAIPNNLPVQLTSFVGREKEITQLQQLIYPAQASPEPGRTAEARLLTLIGPGGTGKTRLGLQVAARVLAAFPDGVWLVELAPLTDPALVAASVAATLGVREQPGQNLLEVLADALHTKCLLLVLDNCEHVVVACAQLAERLLSTGPQLKILATSREALDMAGEATCPVPALALPSLSEPLAIELAAARVRMMSVDEIARRLADCFDLLNAGSRTALPRQQTLRATIDWSYDLLAEPERVLFRRLSVFAGGFSLAAAEAVAAGGPIAPEQVVDLVGQLINKSLVTVVGGAAETRYGMLETIHDYARAKRDEAGEAEALRDRHLQFFAALAQEAGDGIYTAEQAAWFWRLDGDIDNLRAAMSWPAAATPPCEVQLRARLARQFLIIGSLTLYWESRHQREILEALATLLAADGDGQASIERAKALITGGFVLWSANKLPRARAHLEEAARIAEARADTLTLAFALGYLGWTLDSLGDYTAAQAALERSVALGQALGGQGQQAAANARSILGDVLDQQGDFPAARLVFEESIAFLRELHNPAFISYPLRRLAYVRLRDGDQAQAQELVAESRRMNHEMGHLQGVCACLAGFAALRLAQGQGEPAAVLCGAVEAQLQRVGVALYAVDTADYGRCVAQVKVALEPGALAAAWARGRALTMNEAVAYALDSRAQDHA